MTTKDTITITGAREHNLKDINVEIPKDKLIVFTGLSGSGKSSLAFDTLYAEGQRRYVESLSSYARQFLGIMKKPDVDHIEGLSPAISIDQKTTSHNPRSTVGTITEIYDYLRLLFARIGHQYCPDCDLEVSTQTVDEIINKIFEQIAERATTEPARLMIFAPVIKGRKGEFQGLFTNLQKKGYTRIRVDGEMHDLKEDFAPIKTNKHDIDILIDRLVISNSQLKETGEIKTLRSRMSQSIEEALKLTEGQATISFINDASLNFPDDPKDTEEVLFSEKLSCNNCGRSFEELEPRLFSFNSPQGACENCSGLGSLLKIDEDKIIAQSLTLSEGAVIPFARVLTNDSWWARLVKTVAENEGIDFRKTPWEEMPESTQQVFLRGGNKVYQVEGENRFGSMTMIQEKFEGFINNLERRYAETDSAWVQKEIAQYMNRQICNKCGGTRLKPEALAVRILGKNIADITELPINQAAAWSNQLIETDQITEQEKQIAAPILKEISSRLEFLASVGLNYLTLSREAGTLAGGEAQRIRLASQIGTGLTGVLYILDEPTIGLHQRDNHRLIETLKNLQQKGNTVVVVEHDRDVMLAADYVLDFGPKAGKHGGEIVAQGTPQQLIADDNSLTGKYLARKKDVTRQKTGQSKLTDEPKVIDLDTDVQPKSITISGASHHNLQSIDVEFPLHKFACITGISGSGKSTLLHDTLYHQLAKHLGRKTDAIEGTVERSFIPDEVKRVTLIDQSPIGKTPRSNPATYTKMFDVIRQIFAQTQDARIRGYKPGRFSFNVKGGRCEACQGDGQIKIEMQFLPDVFVECDVCHGRRYNQETLEVLYKGKNIAEILDMTVDEAAEFFGHASNLAKKLETLQAVGLGYIHLGQPAPTLSGGEAQRVKLAKELSTKTLDHVVYLLDEPTTGLHFEDVQNLLNVLGKLVDQGNTVIVIEHNLDVIKNADYIIDLGPEGGDEGGQVVATGTPQQVAQQEQSYTGQFLALEFSS